MSGHSFLILLAATCVIGFAAPFAVRSVPDRRGSAPQTSISICSRWDHALRRATCLVDGDTGWEHGVKWRLSDVAVPANFNKAWPRGIVCKA
jgi:hypothetical protein